MSVPFELTPLHLRILSLVSQYPDGLTGEDLVGEMKRLGWCDRDFTPADLGLAPDEVVRRPD